MKQGIKLFVLLLVMGIGIASISVARGGFSYESPNFSAPGDSGEVVPISTGTTVDTKVGGLSVSNFLAEAFAQVGGQTFFTGELRGGNPQSTNSALFFGDDTVPVSVEATGVIATTQTMQSDTLLPESGTSWSYVCAREQGELDICDDLCSNIAGVQPSLPPGTIVDTGGLCGMDVFTGSPTTCQYQMIVSRIDASRARFSLQQGGVSYSATETFTVMVQLDDGSTRTVTVPRGQLSSYDLGATTTRLRVLSVQPGLIGTGEICWSGY